MAKFCCKECQRGQRLKRYYFAYGMNTNIGEMTSRCPKAINLGRCTLKGFELKFRLHADISTYLHTYLSTYPSHRIPPTSDYYGPLDFMTAATEFVAKELTSDKICR